MVNGACEAYIRDVDSLIIQSGDSVTFSLNEFGSFCWMYPTPERSNSEALKLITDCN